MTNDWQLEFRKVYDHGTAAWKSGRKSASAMFGPKEVSFLASIGCSAQELFDFVDDAQRYGEPDYATALELAAIRRRYFLEVLDGRPAVRMIDMDDLPPKAEKVDGIAWLPRIIAKARAKLRGEMPPDLMYDCGGDREFLERVRMTAAEFLQLVWDSGDDDRRIIDAVRKSADAP